MNSPEKFAVSLISLALLRKGYVTSKEVLLSSDEHADILAIRGANDKAEEKFAVEVRCLPGRDAIPEELDRLRMRFAEEFGVTTYLAFFIDKDDLLIVDDELRKRMRFIDEEVHLQTMPSKVLASNLGGST